MITEVECPTCGSKVIWHEKSQWRPFCSERCKLIDLGAWADEQYSIASSDTSAMEFDSMEYNPDQFSKKYQE